MRERRSGKEHPDTLATRANLALWTREAAAAGPGPNWLRRSLRRVNRSVAVPLIRLGGDSDLDRELYIMLYIGPDEIASPDVGLDAVVDFIAEAAQMIPRLVVEIQRLLSL